MILLGLLLLAVLALWPSRSAAWRTHISPSAEPIHGADLIAALTFAAKQQRKPPRLIGWALQREGKKGAVK